MSETFSSERKARFYILEKLFQLLRLLRVSRMWRYMHQCDEIFSLPFESAVMLFRMFSGTFSFDETCNNFQHFAACYFTRMYQLASSSWCLWFWTFQRTAGSGQGIYMGPMFLSLVNMGMQTNLVLFDKATLAGVSSAPYLRCCALDMVKLRLGWAITSTTSTKPKFRLNKTCG